MTLRLNNSVFTVPPLAVLMSLILEGTSCAALVFGMAQSDWANGLESEPTIYSNPFTDSVSADHYIVSNRGYSRELAVLQILQIDPTERNQGSVLGEDFMSESSDSLQRGSAQLAEIWAASNPSAATNWLSSMVNPQGSREALHEFIESWETNEGTGLKIPGDRYSDRSGSRRGANDSVPQWYGDSICSCSEILAPIGNLAVIPEPSSALLGALGGFLLLHRRRTS